jgi:hypothetical protein
MPRFVRAATTGVIAFLSVISCRAPDNGDGTSAGHRIYPRSVAPQQIQRMTSALRERVVDESSTSAPSGAHLNYYGGRVVSNIQVVQVLYGAGSYIPQITSTASPSVATFYQGVLNSPYVDWLTEYATTGLGPPTSNQTIGRGSFSQQVTIAPSAANNGATIDDSNIKAELSAQIQAGTLPAPTQDAAGNNNTYYAVFFPHGKKITMQGNASCVQFCAYHGTIANAGGMGEVYYGVHPDFQAGSGCESGCGAAPTPFGNTTQVASHEMFETMTDPEVGLATVIAAPLAWYDQSYGEIGDICNDLHGTVVGGDNVTYDVQLEFSNAAQDCIVSRVVNPTLTATPSMFEGGAAVTGSVSLGTVAPAGGTVVTLSSSVPSLVTVPASVTVPAGSASATFPVTSVSTTTQTPVVLTATFPTMTVNFSLTVLASPTVAGMSVSPTLLVGGGPVTGMVTLSGPAPTGGAVVSLSSSIPSAAAVPATVTVPEGANSVTFSITTSVVTTPQMATISGSYHNTTKTALLTVVGAPGLASISVSPTSLDGGSSAVGTVTLTNPASSGGLVIALMTSNMTVVSTPASVTVAAGASSATFPITTFPVTAPWTVAVTGTDPLGTNKTALLAVGPPANAAFDATLKVPRCLTVGTYCDTGATLINGRANISGGPELHTPNTLNASCADGTIGTYHADESIDRLKISTVDGSSLAPGKLVEVDATVWVYSNLDSLDVYFAPDATAPVWTLMGTTVPTVASGANVIPISFTLPAGPQPVVRAGWRYLGSAAACTTGSFDDHDDLAFAVVGGPPVNQPPSVNAGPDVAVTLPAPANLVGTVTDDGLPNPPGAVTTTWSQVSGPGTTTFASPNAVSTTATFSAAGTYVLRLTANDGALSASDDVTVTVSPAPPVNQPPVVNAGPDQTIVAGNWAILHGSVTDDGLPNPPGKLTPLWTVVSGPGAVTWQTTASVETAAQMVVPGTYVLRLTVSDSALSGSDDVQVNVLPQNQPPVVNAGPDQAVVLGAAASLAGTVSDDGQPPPPAVFTITWSMVSGPGTVTFADANAAATTATFSAVGSYTLRLTANDSQLSSSDDVVVTVSPAPPVNQPPTANAGPDQTITLPALANLSGTVSDDGLPPPPAVFTTTWSVVSGPGAVTFANASALTTTATFPVAGVYTLRLTANDSLLSSSDDVVITVNPMPNMPPVVNAGPDLIVNEGNWGSLFATVTDDGLPNGTLTPTWTVVSGPGPVTFEHPDHVQTAVQFSVFGNYVLRLTVSDGALSSSDDVAVCYNEIPKVDAGPDQSEIVLTYPTTVSLLGNFTDDFLPNPPGGVTINWSQVSGPAPVSFDNPNQSGVLVTLPMPGIYVMRLSVSDSAATTTDDVVVTLTLPNGPPVANAGPDQTITLPATASLSGTATDDGRPNPPGALTTTWSTVSGPGTVTFGNAGALSTTATFTVPGTYTLRLTASDSLLTGSDDLVVTVNPVPPVNQPPVVSAGDDQTATLAVPATLTLAGAVSDDGLPIPPGATVATWSVVSGPDVVTFDDVHKLAAAATFSTPGSYVLRLTATDGALSTSDDVAVTITLPPPVNQPPVVGAGSNQTITLPAAASLSGTVTDDGLPNPPGAVTATWSKVSGPGTVTFANASAPATTATFSTTGSYVLSLSASDGALSASASVTITVNPGLQIPPAPTGLTATGGNAQVTLSWTASTGATSYAVYRGTAAGGEGATAIATPTATSYVDTGRTNGTTYYYKVAAVNAAGTSGMSSEAAAKPSAGLFIDCGGSASGSWTADSNFTNGSTSHWSNAVNTSLLTGTLPPQTVLQTGRIGNFKYTFSGLVANSSHSVTLYFVENFQTASGKRIFTVSSNGAAVPTLTNVDIFALTGARFKAIQRTFTATANASGQVVLTFVPSKDNASVEGLVFQ